MVLPDPTGKEVDISKPLTPNGVVCIYFWSVFCPNCKEAMPILLELNSAWEKKGLTIWAVNVDGDRFSNAVKAYLDDAGLPFSVAYDKLDGELLVAADPMGVSKTPTLILLDREGRLALRQEINIEPPVIAKKLDELLKQ